MINSLDFTLQKLWIGFCIDILFGFELSIIYKTSWKFFLHHLLINESLAAGVLCLYIECFCEVQIIFTRL